MPSDFARRLTGSARNDRADRELGLLLAFIAGALNAGGFLAVQRYTSHVTGAVSALADLTVLGQFDLALQGLYGIVSFMLGASASTLLVNWGRRRALRSTYALPLLLEAGLILLFGLLGARVLQHGPAMLSLTVALLCFTMGLQNALITKLSEARVRTTHLTGIVTDLGIELGRALDPGRGAHRLQADPQKMLLLLTLFLAFLAGGFAGALGFKSYGYASTLPLALLLGLLALVPALDDLRG